MNAEFTLFQSIRERLPRDYPFDRFMEALVGWDVMPIMIAGELVGAVMTRGNEIHVGFATRPKASIRAAIRGALAPIVEKHGCAVTMVAVDNDAGLRFCHRLGFVTTGLIDGAYRLRCERANYV